MAFGPTDDILRVSLGSDFSLRDFLSILLYIFVGGVSQCMVRMSVSPRRTLPALRLL